MRGVGLARAPIGAARLGTARSARAAPDRDGADDRARYAVGDGRRRAGRDRARSEEHTSELQSLMRISYAVFCLTTKKHHMNDTDQYRSNTTTVECHHDPHFHETN